MLALAQIDRGRRRARSIDSRDSSPEPSILRAVDQANASSSIIPAASIEEEDEEDVPSSQPTVLLRQPIAFNNDMSLVGSIPTYKYTPPPNTTSGSLSGFIGATSQFGTIPQGAMASQPQNISGKAGKRKPKPRSRKYTDGFEDQTVVFRVDAPPDPNLLPSNFERLMSFSATTSQNSRRVVTSAPPSAPTATAPQPEQYLSSGSGPYNSLYRIEKPKKPKQAHPPTSSSSSLPASSSTAQASRFLSRPDVPSPLAGTSSSAYGAAGEDLEVEDGSRILLPPENPPAMKTHYRHNYDKPEAQQPSSSRRKAHMPELLPGPSTPGHPKFQPKPHRIGRMLTLLIKDVRNEGEVDEQLAEIRVPLLRPAGTQAEDGYWVDAVQVVEALQEGVSAIEGAAMVYTMRGPYRQVFLRIQEDGSLNYQPTNLVASRERILHVIVDKLPSKGKIPAAPKIPAGVLPVEEEEESGAVQAVADERRKGKGKQVERIDLTKDDNEVSVSKSKPSRQRRRERLATSSDDSSSYESRRRKRKRQKRRRSPSTSSNDDDSDDRSHRRRKRRYESDDSDHRSRGRKSSRRAEDDSEEDLAQSPGNVQVSARSTISPPPSHKVITIRSPPRLPPAPTLADDPRKVELAITNWIGQKILNHPRYLLHFLKVKGQPPPVPLHKTMILLRFVKEILDQYTGQHTPPDLSNAPSQLVEEQHVLKGLFLPDDWADKYLPFLELMSLYGPEGTRFQHPAIVAEMEDMSKAHGNPLERVRKKLLEIDAEWENSQS